MVRKTYRIRAQMPNTGRLFYNRRTPMTSRRIEVAINRIGARERNLQELILYIAQASNDDPRFSCRKLQKILFYADFSNYKRTGDSITGYEYEKHEEGPFHKELSRALDSLFSQGALAVNGNTVRDLERLSALRPPHVEGISPEEIEIIDQTIELLRDVDGRDISDIPSKFIGWRIAFDGEVVPYHTVFLSDRKLTPAQSRRGAELDPTWTKPSTVTWDQNGRPLAGMVA
jgi:hypothetical protein